MIIYLTMLNLVANVLIVDLGCSSQILQQRFFRYPFVTLKCPAPTQCLIEIFGLWYAHITTNRQRRMQGFEHGKGRAADGAGRCCCSCCGCRCWLWHWRVFLVQVMYQHIREREAGVSCSNYGDCCGSSGSSCPARCYHCFVICCWRILII